MGGILKLEYILTTSIPERLTLALSCLAAQSHDVKSTNLTGETPLFVAVEGGHEKTIELLLKAKANVNVHNNSFVTPLHAAAACGQEKAVELLARADADVNAQVKPGDWTPLHVVLLVRCIMDYNSIYLATIGVTIRKVILWEPVVQLTPYAE